MLNLDYVIFKDIYTFQTLDVTLSRPVIAT